MDVKYNTDTKIEDNSRAFKLQKANFDKEVNTAVSHQIFPDLGRVRDYAFHGHLIDLAHLPLYIE